MTELEALRWVLENKYDVQHVAGGVSILRNEFHIWGTTFLDAVIMAKRMLQPQG